MPQHPLSAYLTDHLAGSSAAVAMLSRLVRTHKEFDPDGVLLEVLQDIRADQRTLEGLIKVIGSAPSPAKNFLGRLTAKALRLRTSRMAGKTGRFALFEGLELLAVGVTGKRCLWRALHAVAQQHDAVRRLDLLTLERRAENQFDRVERFRVAIAAAALTPMPVRGGARSATRKAAIRRTA
jgi:hypothetical protein